MGTRCGERYSAPLCSQPTYGRCLVHRPSNRAPMSARADSATPANAAAPPSRTAFRSAMVAAMSTPAAAGRRTPDVASTRAMAGGAAVYSEGGGQAGAANDWSVSLRHSSATPTPREAYNRANRCNYVTVRLRMRVCVWWNRGFGLD